MWSLVWRIVICIFSVYGIAVFYHQQGIALWITALVVIIKSIAYLLAAFYGIEWILARLKKRPTAAFIFREIEQGWNFIFEQIDPVIDAVFGRIVRTKTRINNETTNWLIRKKEWVVIISGFVPWVPFLSTAVIAAFKIMKIKYSFPILVAAAIFKSVVLCLTVYGILPAP